MTTQEDAAYSQKGHIRGGVRFVSPWNGFEPAKIQYRVDSEQRQHSASQPYMGRLADQAVRREKRQESGNEDIIDTLYISSVQSRCGKPPRRGEPTPSSRFLLSAPHFMQKCGAKRGAALFIRLCPKRKEVAGRPRNEKISCVFSNPQIFDFYLSPSFAPFLHH